MATMKRVAARANVSISTVSRVVNQSGYVASSVRENVLKAVKELGYQPSAVARGLRTSSTPSVGVLVPQPARPYFSAIAIAAEKHLGITRFHTPIFFMSKPKILIDPQPRTMDLIFDAEDKRRL